QTFERHLFSEQVTMTDCSATLHELFLTGPRARDALGTLSESVISQMQILGSAPLSLIGHSTTVFRDDPASVPGYTIIGSVEAIPRLWKDFTESENPAAPTHEQDMRFRGLARPVGWAAFNATRIEGGRPIFGIDFDESILPAETGQMERAVSLTKGCYL